MILSSDTLTVALVALLVDAAFGWPQVLYRRISHPVVWIGALITTLDRCWNQGRSRVAKGALAVLVTLTAAVVPAILLTWLLIGLPFGPVMLGVLAWPLVAARSLHDHVAAVAVPLAAGDPAQARQAVSLIVGRDLTDEPAPIARAALESLAENSSDGIVAPLLWAAVGGLPGIAAYKAINTLDSMIGHMTVRHALFGRVAARLDDVVNLPASRLTGFLLAFSAGSPQAMQVMWRDAGRHRSPNAGWPEAAMAGALDVRLSGPRSYHGVESAEPWLNSDARDPDAGDLTKGLMLYRRMVAACGIALGTGLLLTL